MISEFHFDDFRKSLGPFFRNITKKESNPMRVAFFFM